MKFLTLLLSALIMTTLMGCDDPKDSNTGVLVFGTDSETTSSDQTANTDNSTDTNSEKATDSESDNVIETDSDSDSGSETDATTLTCDDVSACDELGMMNSYTYICTDPKPGQSCLVVPACGKSAVMCVTNEEACTLQGCTQENCMTLDTDRQL